MNSSDLEFKTAASNFEEYDLETFNFLKPYSIMLGQETQTSYSPFTQLAQVIEHGDEIKLY